MITQRYPTQVLFSKISTADQDLIIKGFSDYYRSKVETPLKYDNTRLEQEIIDHFELYEETRMFNDRELVVLVGVWCATMLREDLIAEKYPEFFV